MRIGVLELQGDFEKHHQILQTLGMDSVAVRGPSDLDELEGLVIPGSQPRQGTQRWAGARILRERSRLRRAALCRR